MHQQFMHRCLDLAELGRGKTGINPMVGAVLVRDGKVIAEGFHSEFGKSHAERDLLANNDQIICSTDTLYVNLEPCCHTKKKTPPCTDLIIQSGVKHVVFGMYDPNPAVSGKGINALRKGGLKVTGPVLEDECLRLNRGFVSLQRNLRPWITIKMARTVDGKFAKSDGSPLRITNEEQDRWSHEFLRARHDAILVGIGTILRDDPRLTVRASSERLPTVASAKAGVADSQQLYRVILDSKLQIPLTAKVVTDQHSSQTIVVCSSDADRKKKSDLESRGVRVIEIPTREARLRLRATDGQASRSLSAIFDWTLLWKALTTPRDSFYGISSILVEGGRKTWTSFADAGMIDQEITLLGS